MEKLKNKSAVTKHKTKQSISTSTKHSIVSDRRTQKGIQSTNGKKNEQLRTENEKQPSIYQRLEELIN